MLEKTYQKINAIFKRDPNGKLLFGEYSDVETAMLKNLTWIGTEKVDGTNTRILWDGTTLKVLGRKNNSQITPYIQNATNKYLDVDKFKAMFNNKEVIIFGESYGQKIQTVGSQYLPDSNDFIVFDVMIDGLYLSKENVANVATNLGMKSVPIVFKGPLDEAIEKVSKGFKSTLGDLIAEGLVLIPENSLRKRNGDRIITKIKYKDFRK